MSALTGHVYAVRGLTVDLTYPDARVPRPGELAHIGGAGTLHRAEVAHRVGRGLVRAVLLDAPWGLRLGLPAVTDGPAQVPTGQTVLGRVLDPIGRPLDGDPPPGADTPVRPLATDVSTTPLLLSRPLPTAGRVGGLTLPRGGVAALHGPGDPLATVDLTRAAVTGGAVAVVAAVGWGLADLHRAVHLWGGSRARIAVLAAPAGAPPALRWRVWHAAVAVAEALLADGREVVLVFDGPERHDAAGAETRALLDRGAPPQADDPDPVRAGPGDARLTVVERLAPPRAPVLVDEDDDDPLVGRLRALAALAPAGPARHADAVVDPPSGEQAHP